MRCKVDHKAIKLDDALWGALTYVGVQRGFNDDGDPDPSEDLELRNCQCGSTLCRPVKSAG